MGISKRSSMLHRQHSAIRIWICLSRPGLARPRFGCERGFKPDSTSKRPVKNAGFFVFPRDRFKDKLIFDRDFHSRGHGPNPAFLQSLRTCSALLSCRLRIPARPSSSAVGLDRDPLNGRMLPVLGSGFAIIQIINSRTHCGSLERFSSRRPRFLRASLFLRCRSMAARRASGCCLLHRYPVSFARLRFHSVSSSGSSLNTTERAAPQTPGVS